jgi:hypothetical protein
MSFEKPMRFKLSYKIFATLALTSLLVVALMVGLIKLYAARNFADYVNRSLLERYSQVAEALAAEYQNNRSWQVLKDYPGRWQEILRTGLLQRDFDPYNRPPRSPDSETKAFSGRSQDRPSPEPSRRIQRLARRLALFDTDRQHIAGGRTGVAHDGFTLQAIFRRLHAKPLIQNLAVGSISLDDKTHQVMIDQQILNLTPNEFGLLKIMMSQPNRVFSKNELINQIQGYDFEGYDRTIDTHIKNLRKKIAERLPGQEIISTVYGVGYKFSAVGH